MKPLLAAAALAIVLAACGGSGVQGPGGSGGGAGSSGSGGSGGTHGECGGAGGCPVCGDGMQEGAEDCDQGDLGGASCSTRGFADGTLACTATCTFDESGCTQNTCSTAADCSKPTCATAPVCLRLSILSPPPTARVDGGANLIVVAKTAAGAAVPGVSVTVDAPPGAQGVVVPLVTAANGQARALVHMGRKPGMFTFTARTGGDQGPTAQATIDVTDPPAGTIHTVVNIDHASGDEGSGSAIGAHVGTIIDLQVTSDGTLYLAEPCRVLSVSPEGILSQVAGTGTCGTDEASGPALSAAIGIDAMALDEPNRTLLLADSAGGRVRAVDLAAGTIRTVAGGGNVAGAAADGKQATQAKLAPGSVSLAPDGQYYVADGASRSMRRIDAQGVIHTLLAAVNAGDDKACNPPLALFGCDSNCRVIFDAAAQPFLAAPVCGTLAGDGTTGATGTADGLIRIDAGNKLVHVAGQATGVGVFPATARATDSTFPGPLHGAFDPAGNLLVVSGNDLFRIDDVTGWATELAGIGVASAKGEQVLLAGNDIGFNQPTALAIGPGGDLYIADSKNDSVRRVVAFAETTPTLPHLDITPGGASNTIIGQIMNPVLKFRVLFQNKPLYYQSLVLDPLEPSALVLSSADSDDMGKFTRSVRLGFAPGEQIFQPMLPDIHGGLGPTDAAFHLEARAPDAGTILTVSSTNKSKLPTPGHSVPSMALDSGYAAMVGAGDGTSYVSGDCRIFRIKGGVADLVAGTTCGDAGDGGAATDAQIDPGALALDPAGKILYVATRDPAGKVRAIDLGTGLIHAFAGGGTLAVGAGDGGPALDATFGPIQGLAVDAQGLVYIPDATPGAGIRRVDPGSGLIDTFARSGTCGATDDARLNGAGTLTAVGNDIYAAAEDCSDHSALVRIDSGGVPHLAMTGSVTALAPGPSGALAVGLQDNHQVELYDPGLGTSTPVAGGGAFPADDVPALQTQLTDIIGLAYDVAGHLYIQQYAFLRLVW